ncbi:MAG TPA: D-alanyl-D-alanine carboxypeptidase family protein [Chthoniobacteraceae bacterium]|nr:D-alanyl-D-alanine carboxypeptidase family protein [Chthoniobacteraceae bacterium]
MARTPNASVILALLAALALPGAATHAKTTRPKKKAVHKSTPAPAPVPSPTPPPESDSSAPDDELHLAAQGAFLIDGLTGETLYEKQPDHLFYPASTTKILTALLVIEAGNLDQTVTIQPEDTKVEPSAIEVKPGEKYTRLQLLYGLLLKSANDAALVLARDNAGSVSAFADKMNLRARELGATSSHFENPHGLHNKNHYTTPHDLALIARAAMQQPLFRRIVGTVDYTLVTDDGPLPLTNHNKLLTMYPGCTGVKTGYTVAAQQVLVGAALKDGREVISVVMHTDHPGIWEDSKTLLNYGFSHFPAIP